MIYKISAITCSSLLQLNEDKFLFSSRAYWKIARNYGELDTLKSPKDALFKLNEKYGKGTVDINTGEFVPEN